MSASRSKIDELITPRVLQLWRTLCEIYDAEQDKRWEHDDPPGRQREFLDTQVELERVLNIPPWEENPFDADCPTPPDYYSGRARTAWVAAWALRQRIERALAEQDAR